MLNANIASKKKALKKGKYFENDIAGTLKESVCKRGYNLSLTQIYLNSF